MNADDMAMPKTGVLAAVLLINFFWQISASSTGLPVKFGH